MAEKKTKAAAEQAVASPVEEVKKEIKKAETEVVHLIGQGGQLVGLHSIFADGKLVAEFHDGVAEVSAEVAKLLKSWGLAE